MTFEIDEATVYDVDLTGGPEWIVVDRLPEPQEVIQIRVWQDKR